MFDKYEKNNIAKGSGKIYMKHNEIMKMAKIFFLPLVLFCTGIMIIGAQSLAIAGEVPKSPYYPNSNEDWWQYQFDGYPDYSNHNCGPACSAIIINYLKGKGVTTTYHTQISASYPAIHCYARWNYCQGNGHPNGYANSDWSSPGATTAQIQNALSSEGIQTHTFTCYDCCNDGRGITNLQNAIDQGKVCICLVDPSCYRSTTCHSHWVVAYGYDNNYVYLNDPGYSTGKGFKATKANFADALWKVTELSTVIVSDTKIENNTGSLTVTNPQVSYTWNYASRVKVEWDYSGYSGNIAIDIYKGGEAPNQNQIRIVSSVPVSQRQIDIDLPTSLVPGTDYKIGISATPSGDPWDFSDFFAIRRLRVTYPNDEGLTFNPSQTINVSWNHDYVTSNLLIELYKGGTTKDKWIATLILNTPNDGNENVTLPSNANGTDYKIGISAHGGYVWDFSDNYFTISIPQNHNPVLSNPSVSPPSGDTNTDFYYYVHYYDQDGDSPERKWLMIDGTICIMRLSSGSPNNGTYEFCPQKLSTGNHNYYFNFTDGKGGSVMLPSTPGNYFSGPNVIEPPETVSTPNTPTGPSSGKVGQSLSFSTGGSSSNLGHSVEYQFNWGDGNQSSWGSSTQSYSYSSSGTKYVKAHARCQTHTSVISDWSSTKSVSISYCTLTINVSTSGSGSVTKNPNKTNYDYNETVQLTANSNSDYQFDHWGGNLSGSDNPINLTMNDNKSVTAYFTQVQETVSIPSTPTGPSSGKVGQSLSFSTGGSISNLGHPVEYQYEWGDGNQSSWGSASQNRSYTISGTKYIKARARCQTHTSVVSGWSSTKSVSISYCTLTINVSPSGSGSVIKNPNKTNYDYNETVQLTANANSDYDFDHWGGDLSGSDSGDNPINITMNSNKSVTAYFTQIQETVSTPNIPSGPSSGKVGQSLSFSTGGSNSNLGHSVEYQFDWGDGTQSGWGSSSQSHSYSSSGTKNIKSRARCQIHTGVVSGWSSTSSVSISYCTLTTNLNSSWNLVSWNVDTPNDSVSLLLSDIMVNLVIALGFEKIGLTYDPKWPQFSNLHTVDHLHGYWLNLSAEKSFSLIGSYVSPSTPIELEAGWNLVSYLPNNSMDIENALGSIMDKVIVVLGFDRSGLTYDPAWPQFSNLKILSPGFGYWIKVTESCILIYPDT